MFTVEEITLLRAFDTSTRRTAILSLMKEMGMMQDEELIAQCMSMVKKLENVTDTDFAGVDFTVYDDDGEAEHAGQTKYLKPEDRAGHPEAANIHYADCLKSSPKRTKKVPPKAVSSNPEYLTVDEAALMAGVEHGRILKWIRKNRFPVVRSGKKLIRIPRTAFEDFLLKTHETEE